MDENKLPIPSIQGTYFTIDFYRIWALRKKDIGVSKTVEHVFILRSDPAQN